MKQLRDTYPNLPTTLEPSALKLTGEYCLAANPSLWWAIYATPDGGWYCCIQDTIAARGKYSRDFDEINQFIDLHNI